MNDDGTTYLLNKCVYRVRTKQPFAGRIEFKSGHSNVWILTDWYKTLDELLKAGAKPQ